MECILHRKEKLIITTIEIIDECGIKGLSTREIARREGVSEATLFRHFKSKNELLGAVLDYYSQFDEDIFLSTRMKQLSSIDSLIFLVATVTEYYENYPAITSIMQLFEVLLREPQLEDKVRNVLYKRNTYMKQLIDEAQGNNDIKTGIDSEIIAEMISGFIREICLRWRLDKTAFSLKERTLSALEIILGSLKLNQETGYMK